ncbi:phage tail spike protein [Lactobacillus sp. ESL0225]|uniref:phage tail spike protein n=1 Tax=Lactobacillus sp. ESL0225 TaxID=2069351 RepID=UPI000EFCD2E2|nr:phage tail spike protein [Lactobacillus sp. ESL0225]RMC47739.1 hypothetical protein F5ESL0225_08245 [Lactobacillus sp. ESL0225]
MTNYLRYPILFENATDNDKTNGIGALVDCLSCQVVQTVNTIPTLSLTYKADGKLAKELKSGRIIMVDASPNLLRQKFRIQEVSKTLDEITVQAVHIASDFTNRVITKDISLPNLSASQCFKELQNAMPGLEAINGVEFTTDITDLANINYSVDQNSDTSSILMGADQIGDEPTQSMQSLYKGKWIFDNYKFKFLKNPGKNTNQVIKHGRDLGSISKDENISQMYTGIFPFAKYTPTPKKPLPTDMTQAGVPYDGQGTVQYLGSGDLTTYDSPYPGHNPIGSVANGAKLKIMRKLDGSSDPAPMNNDDWYMLSNNAWVDAAFITFDKSGDYVINAGNGQGHITAGKDSKGISYPASGTATVGIDVVHCYYSPFLGSSHYRTGDKYKIGQRISYSQIAIDENGNKWYKVGSNSWVYGPHLRFDTAGDIAYQPATGRVWIKDNSPVYTKPGTPMTSPIYPTHGNPKPLTISGGYYNILGQATADGVQYYKLATNRWVKVSSCDWSKKKAKKPQTPKDYVDHEIKTNGSIELHDRPGGQAIAATIPVGTQLKVLGTADVNGESWSQVSYNGQTGWVLSSSIDYSADDDVPPDWGSGNSDSDDETEEAPQQEILVTLPQTFIYAENWIGKEHQKLATVDLSQYWNPDNDNTTGQPTQADIDQLTSLAQSYMKQNRIGQPDPSCTLTENEVGKIDQANLYDTVGVEYDEIGIQLTAQVTSTTFNALAHRYISKTIGSLPVSYDHVLLKTANTTTNAKFSQATTRIDRVNDFAGRINQGLKAEGADRERAFDKLKTDLHDQKEKLDDFEGHMQKMGVEVQEFGDWIAKGGTDNAVLYPRSLDGTKTWKDVVEIAAEASDHKMVFNNRGIGWYDSTGGFHAGLGWSSDGGGKLFVDKAIIPVIDASHIDVDTIHALGTIEGSLEVSKEDNSSKIVIGVPSNDDTQFGISIGQNLWIESTGITTPDLTVNGVGSFVQVDVDGIITITKDGITNNNSGHVMWSNSKYNNLGEYINNHIKSSAIIGGSV